MILQTGWLTVVIGRFAVNATAGGNEISASRVWDMFGKSTAKAPRARVNEVRICVANIGNRW